MFKLCQKLKKCILNWTLYQYVLVSGVHMSLSNTFQTQEHIVKDVWASLVRYSELYHKKVFGALGWSCWRVKLPVSNELAIAWGGLCPLASHVEILFSTLQRGLVTESAEFCSTGWFLSLLQAAISLFVVHKPSV